MPFAEPHKHFLENITDANWYQISGAENRDWISSGAMSYLDAMALQRGFHINVQAQLLPSNSHPGQFQVAIYWPQLTQMIENSQAVFLNPIYSQNNLMRQIQNAKNLEELINIINQHPAQMFSRNGLPILKKDQIAAIRNQQNPDPNFPTKVTSNYGLEEKVAEFIQQEQQLKLAKQRPLPQPNHNVSQQPPPKSGMLKASQEEWERAEAYFAQDFSKKPDLDPTKMKKQKGDPNSHSFIKVDGEIYQMATRHCFDEEKHAKLGQGAFGMVKVVQTRDGENFAVKVEGRGVRGEHDAETKIGKILNFVKGEAERNFAFQKDFMNKKTFQKLYTVMQLKKGNELFKELYLDVNAQQRSGKFNQTQSLIIALKACQSIDELHKLNIIHSDIKPENFMSNVDGNMITVSAIDFGLSSILRSENEVRYSQHYYGTPGYIAPESVTPENGWYQFSKASDVYSLGVMLRDDLQMPRHIYEKMLNIKPNERPSLSAVMKDLVVELQKQKNLDPEAKKVIAEFLEANKPKTPSIELGELVNQLLQKNHSQLTVEYEKLRQGKGDGAVGWARARAKDVGGIFTNAGQKRADQLAELSRAFEILKNDKDLSSDDKAKYAYGYILNLSTELKKEENKFASGLQQLCDQYIKQIEKSIDDTMKNRFAADPSASKLGEALQEKVRSTLGIEQVVRSENKKR